jgi:hypothetical protein
MPNKINTSNSQKDIIDGIQEAIKICNEYESEINVHYDEFPMGQRSEVREIIKKLNDFILEQP